MSPTKSTIPLFFRCDTGSALDQARLTRCLTLADALVHRAGEGAVFVGHAADANSEQRVTARGHTWRPSPDPAGDIKDLKFITNVLRLQPVRPLLVIDSKTVGEEYVAHCRDVSLTVCLDDELARDLPCQMIVNPNAWSARDAYPDRDDRMILTGPEYNLVAKAFFRAVPGPNAKPPRVLIAMNDDPGNHTTWVLETLGALMAGYPVTVIAGATHPNPAAVQLAAHVRVPHADVVRSPATLLPFITKSDIAITTGDSTCYELAAARVPQAAIVAEDRQGKLVHAMHQLGCLAILGTRDHLPEAHCREVLTRLFESPEERRRMAMAQERVFPASGVPRVADTILEAYGTAA